MISEQILGDIKRDVEKGITECNRLHSDVVIVLRLLDGAIIREKLTPVRQRALDELNEWTGLRCCPIQEDEI